MKKLKLPINKEKKVIKEELQDLINSQFELSFVDEQALSIEISNGNHFLLKSW